MKQIYTLLALIVLALSAQGRPVNETNGPVIVSNQQPLAFSGFYAVKNSSDVILVWSTSHELNNNNFEIQRSTDGKNWKVIALVLGAGNSTTAMQYCYTDRRAATAATWYRIRQVDNDTAVYSIVKNL